MKKIALMALYVCGNCYAVSENVVPTHELVGVGVLEPRQPNILPPLNPDGPDLIGRAQMRLAHHYINRYDTEARDRVVRELADARVEFAHALDTYTQLQQVYNDRLAELAQAQSQRFGNPSLAEAVERAQEAFNLVEQNFLSHTAIYNDVSVRRYQAQARADDMFLNAVRLLNLPRIRNFEIGDTL